MKAKILYIIVMLAMLAFLIGISQARADRLININLVVVEHPTSPAPQEQT
jgi:hypothetical protein